MAGRIGANEIGRRLTARLDRLRGSVGRRGDGSTSVPQAFPPGAFYSPVPDALALVDGPDRQRLWPADADDPPGIDVRADSQLALLDRLGRYRLPVLSDATGTPQAQAYDPANDQFPPQDAAVLHAMVSMSAPARVIEVGCGWSTTVTARAIADSDLSTRLTCIDPYPRDFLASIPQVTEIRSQKVEHTPMAVFDALEAGDVLFIDSSHVAKTGSDVVHLFLQVLPRLAPGVVVHVHDVFWPLDYPESWVRAGFGWNEQYLLQAFLVGHTAARILLMNRWLSVHHPDAVADAFGPVGLDGSSVWFVLGDVPESLA